MKHHERYENDRVNKILSRLRKHGCSWSREELNRWHGERLAAADGRCDWCRATFRTAARKREPFIDHDHATGNPRALLCANCNAIEGHTRGKSLVEKAEHLERIAHAWREAK